MCLYQVMMTLHFLMTSLMTLNQHKNRKFVIIASLKSESVGKLINRIPGSRLLISSYQAPLWKRMLNWSTSLAMSTSVLKALPGKLDIKRHPPSSLYFSLILWIAHCEMWIANILHVSKINWIYKGQTTKLFWPIRASSCELCIASCKLWIVHCELQVVLQVWKNLFDVWFYTHLKWFYKYI